MATLDIILLCCFIPGIIRGLSKGFLEQALALAGVVLSVWAAFHFSNLVCSWLKPYLDVSETTLNVISFAIILVGISIGVVIILFDTVNAKFAFVKPEVLDSSIVYTSLRDLSYLVFPYLKSFFFQQ